MQLCGELWVDSGSCGDDECLVGGATLRFQLSVVDDDLFQQAVADIVAVIAQRVDLQDAADKLRSFLVHRVDVELHEQTFRTWFQAFLPHIAYGQIDEEVVVGLSCLQDTLAAFDIVHEERCIAPDAIGGTHVDGGIEFPAWPRIVLR